MKRKINKDKTEWIIPAGLFIGMGIGFITGNLVGYLFVGLGAGFLVSAIIGIIKNKKRGEKWRK